MLEAEPLVERRVSLGRRLEVRRQSGCVGPFEGPPEEPASRGRRPGPPGRRRRRGRRSAAREGAFAPSVVIVINALGSDRPKTAANCGRVEGLGPQRHPPAAGRQLEAGARALRRHPDRARGKDDVAELQREEAQELVVSAALVGEQPAEDRVVLERRGERAGERLPRRRTGSPGPIPARPRGPASQLSVRLSPTSVTLRRET